MALSDYIHTFGQFMLRRHGQRVHKIALDAGFTCPNRDGSKGIGGCTFCNNASFSPNARDAPSIATQLASGRRAIARRTRARRFIAYFQAYTNTYASVQQLDTLYREALSEPDVIGLASSDLSRTDWLRTESTWSICKECDTKPITHF